MVRRLSWRLPGPQKPYIYTPAEAHGKLTNFILKRTLLSFFLSFFLSCIFSFLFFWGVGGPRSWCFRSHLQLTFRRARCPASRGAEMGSPASSPQRGRSPKRRAEVFGCSCPGFSVFGCSKKWSWGLLWALGGLVPCKFPVALKTCLVFGFVRSNSRFVECCCDLVLRGPSRNYGGIWVWLKIKQECLRRFWSMFPLTRATHVGIPVF